MKSKYSEAFIEQALVKIYSRGDRTVRSVAEDILHAAIKYVFCYTDLRSPYIFSLRVTCKTQ